MCRPRGSVDTLAGNAAAGVLIAILVRDGRSLHTYVGTMDVSRKRIPGLGFSVGLLVALKARNFILNGLVRPPYYCCGSTVAAAATAAPGMPIRRCFVGSRFCFFATCSHRLQFASSFGLRARQAGAQIAFFNDEIRCLRPNIAQLIKKSADELCLRMTGRDLLVCPSLPMLLLALLLSCC